MILVYKKAKSIKIVYCKKKLFCRGLILNNNNNFINNNFTNSIVKLIKKMVMWKDYTYNVCI